MKTHIGANWTTSPRTQVAKRKKANYIEALTRAAIAALKSPGKSVLLLDYLTWPQLRILTAEGLKHDMEPGPYLIRLIEVGREVWCKEKGFDPVTGEKLQRKSEVTAA